MSSNRRSHHDSGMPAGAGADLLGGPADDVIAAAGCAEASTASRVTSATILRGARCIEISHRGSVYRLRETQHGKLILTK